MEKTYATINTIIGDLLTTAKDDTLTGVYQKEQPNIPSDEELGDRISVRGFEDVAVQLNEYFDRKRKHFQVFAIPNGTEFQKQVWRTVDEIPYGETVTYKELAEMMGKETSVRAIASAVAKNPLTIIIPCHRVVSANGDEFYSGGKETKKFLLELERSKKKVI